jgi:DNA-binding NarL/FixJ family response regulator
VTITVGLADDQQLIRLGLRTLLESEDDLQLLWEAENGQQACELTRRSPPDVILMDIRMPVLDGISALRQIAADPALTAVRVVVLTTFESDEHVFAALRAGAAGFLIKDAEPADLIRAVRLATAGESLLSPTVARRVIDSLRDSNGPQPVRRHPGLAELTEREREILALIGEGLNNDEIGRRLYISPATARTHVGRALTKLGARDRAQLVVIAYQSGLVT